MVYGSILGDVKSFSVSAADGIEQRIKNNLITSLGIKLLGIPHMGLRIRTATILKFLSPQEGDVILDAGCGIGLCLLTLARRIKQGYGVDIDNTKISEAVRLAKELSVNNIIFKSNDASNLDFPERYFDKIICSEVLEHVKDDLKLLKGFFRLLKSKGILVVSTTSLSKINQAHREKFGHQRTGYSLKELKTLFTKSGFLIEKITPYCLLFGKISWKINRTLLRNTLINSLLFYPLIFFASLDRIFLGNLNRDCIGYIILLRKE